MKNARKILCVVIAAVMALSCLAGCGAKGSTAQICLTSTEQAQNMEWYNHSFELKNTLTAQEPVKLTKVDGESKLFTITVDPSITYQTMLGIGTSMEESTVNNLLQMDEKVREQFLRELIDPENGTGYTAFRVTIGTADFTGQEFYTYYDDVPESFDTIDWYNESGKGFSIQKDIDFGITGVLQQILSIADELGIKDQITFIASPWSPPGWMKAPTGLLLSAKDNEKFLKGGKLRDDCIDQLAIYQRRYVEEYAKLGIPIYAMTLQNEPQLEIEYPSCLITGEQEGKLAVALRKELDSSDLLKEAGVSPKIWVFDHNFSEAYGYTYKVFSVEGARDAIDGVAFHDYSGSPTEMQKVTDKVLDDDQTVALTERSVWGTEGANSIIMYLRNGAVSYNAWVTMLDSNIAPEQWTGTPDPTLFVRQAGDPEKYWATPEVYMIGNFARFLRPGFIRIESNYGSPTEVTNVCYMNPEDGSIAGVFVNAGDNDKTFRVVCGDEQFIATIPGKNIASIVWTPTAAED